jgi:hypothetical protein
MYYKNNSKSYNKIKFLNNLICIFKIYEKIELIIEIYIINRKIKEIKLFL